MPYGKSVAVAALTAFSSVFLVVANPVEVRSVEREAPAEEAPPLDSFEVQDFAADDGISPSEARKRLSWQMAANPLHPELRRLYPDVYAGLWFDRASGTPIIAMKRGTPAAVIKSARENVLAPAGLADIALIKDQAEHSHAVLVDLADRTAPELAEASRGQKHTLTLSIRVRDNVLSLAAPDDAGLTPQQRSLVARLRAHPAVRIHRGEERLAEQGTCSASSGTLNCDPPARGGTRVFIPGMGNCTVGFFVRSKSDSFPYLSTAGHCFSLEDLYAKAYGYYADGSQMIFGQVHNRLYGRFGDMSIFRVSSEWNPRPLVYVNSSAWTSPDSAYYIANDYTPQEGSRVCISGAASRMTECATVTVGYILPDGIPGIRANFCQPVGGDSGAPIFTSHAALGIHRGKLDSTDPCAYVFTDIANVEEHLNVNVVHGTS